MSDGIFDTSAKSGEDTFSISELEAIHTSTSIGSSVIHFIVIS
jgi:hypothetical protein